MINSPANQNFKGTPAERRVKKANDYLREELGIRTKIDLEGNRLRIRKTLPPRPNSGHTKRYQQTVTLGLNADRKGIEQALKDVIELNNLLAQRRFDWKVWDQYLRRPCQHRVNQNELIGAQVEKFKKHFLALPKTKISREDAWRTQWSQYLNKLPFDQYLSDQVLSEAIHQKTEEGSSNREQCCNKLKTFIEFLEFETELDFTALGKGYKLLPVTEDELPTDEEIVAALALIDDPAWRTAYMLTGYFIFLNRLER